MFLEERLPIIVGYHFENHFHMDHEHTFEAGVCTQCGAKEADVNKAPAEGDGGGEGSSEAPAEGGEETPSA